jgi:hypothetical protein
VNVSVSALADHGVLLFLAPVMKVPKLRREEFYRRILELSFLATSDAAFSIDAQKEEVFVRALRRLSALDYEEFEDLLTTVGKVADSWDGPLLASGKGSGAGFWRSSRIAIADSRRSLRATPRAPQASPAASPEAAVELSSSLVRLTSCEALEPCGSLFHRHSGATVFSGD